MPFREMENISSFLTAARAMGLPEADCFSTPDLYDSKDLGQVRVHAFSASYGVIRVDITVMHMGMMRVCVGRICVHWATLIISFRKPFHYRHYRESVIGPVVELNQK